MECVALTEDPRAIARRHLADAAHGWSVGTWGAIGEFQYDAGEPCLAVDLDRLAVTSLRGALHIGDLSGAQPFALVDDAGQTREIAFCSSRAGAQRTTIHQLDERHLRSRHRRAAHRHAGKAPRRRCSDPCRLAGKHRASLAGAGQPGRPRHRPVEPDAHFRLGAGAARSPSADSPPGGHSPEGPHSHLLPKYLQEGRAHAPGSPLPAGLYCGLSLYPRTRL